MTLLVLSITSFRFPHRTCATSHWQPLWSHHQTNLSTHPDRCLCYIYRVHASTQAHAQFNTQTQNSSMHLFTWECTTTPNRNTNATKYNSTFLHSRQKYIYILLTSTTRVNATDNQIILLYLNWIYYIISSSKMSPNGHAQSSEFHHFCCLLGGLVNNQQLIMGPSSGEYICLITFWNICYANGNTIWPRWEYIMLIGKVLRSTDQTTAQT